MGRMRKELIFHVITLLIQNSKKAQQYNVRSDNDNPAPPEQIVCRVGSERISACSG